MNLEPQPNDLLVIPEDMELKQEVPCSVYRMKYLHQPSIIRSGSYNMNAVSDITVSTIARWLGKQVDDFIVKPLTNLTQATSGVLTDIEQNAEDYRGGTEEVPQKRELPTFYRHFRCYREELYVSGTKRVILPKGGLTLYIELNPAEKTLAFSYALCHTSDNFEKNIGRLISKGRFEAEDWYEVANCMEELDAAGNISTAIYELIYNSESGTINAERKGPYIDSVSDKFKVQDMKDIFERIY